MKNVKNNPELANVEAVAAEEPSRELSPIEKKAAAVLRAKLPHLSENGLNFEKRTGNFFRATIQTQDDGTEKVSRLVVADADIEGMTDALAAEMSIKRAAARIMSAESDAAKLEKQIEKARAELSALEAEEIAAAADLEKAVADVEAYELPEKAARETLSAKVAAAESKAAAVLSENQRLREMLIAAGLDPDKM
jgi:ATPase subunit of ABC transporter with duplicated ATPase domains